jgi:hypothetical protein
MGLVLIEAGDTTGVKLRIRDRATLLAHPCLTEAAAGLQQPVVTLAVGHVLPS